MSKEYYSTKVVELVGQVADFVAAAKMIILFETEMSFFPCSFMVTFS